MAIQLGDSAPDSRKRPQKGPIHLYGSGRGDSWVFSLASQRLYPGMHAPNSGWSPKLNTGVRQTQCQGHRPEAWTRSPIHRRL